MSSSWPKATAASVACLRVGLGCDQRPQAFEAEDVAGGIARLEQTIGIEGEPVSDSQAEL